MDYFILLALALAVAFVLGLVYFSKKPETQLPASFTEAELNEMSNKGKKKVKQPAAKLPSSPVPLSSKRIKVEGAHEHDNEEDVLKFLRGRVTLDSKTTRADPEDGESKTQKAPKQAADLAGGFLPTADRKKPAKKENEGSPSEKRDEGKKKARSFYKDDEEAFKREQEAKQAEFKARPREPREPRGEPREPREPRNPNAPRNGPRNQDSQGEGENTDGEQRRRPDRPKREFQPIVPNVAEPFEEWSIDSILDSITAAQSGTSKGKRSKEVVEVDTSAVIE